MCCGWGWCCGKNLYVNLVHRGKIFQRNTSQLFLVCFFFPFCVGGRERDEFKKKLVSLKGTPFFLLFRDSMFFFCCVWFRCFGGCSFFFLRFFSHEQKPLENYEAEIVVNGSEVKFSLWDTAGQEGYARIRTLSYPKTDIFLLCFSVDNQPSLANVRDRWFKEVFFFRFLFFPFFFTPPPNPP